MVEYDFDNMSVDKYALEGLIKGGELTQLYRAFIWGATPQGCEFWHLQAIGTETLALDVLKDMLKQYNEWSGESAISLPEGGHKIGVTGGPSSYYDFKKDWVTWNDLADYKSKNQWKEHSFHIGNIGKAIIRWGDKAGTTLSYDTRKIIYSGLRILLMLEGQEKTQEYLKELLEDRQFNKEEKDNV